MEKTECPIKFLNPIQQKIAKSKNQATQKPVGLHTSDSNAAVPSTSGLHEKLKMLNDIRKELSDNKTNMTKVEVQNQCLSLLQFLDEIDEPTSSHSASGTITFPYTII